MELGTAFVGGAVGLVSGLITAYAAMRFRLREERAKSAKELALKYAAARADAAPTARSMAEQFGTCFLIVHQPGQERRKTFLLLGTRLVVGRAESADIQVAATDTQVSRHHMAFEARATGVFAIDFSSNTGTWINGGRVEESARLESGDVVTIGQAHITFVEL